VNYQETLDYLFTQLPMYQRVGQAAYKVDLSNTYKLCELLEHPENKFKSVHIAGTNGKGSTSHMVASILQEAGLKVGLYTSPHLKDFRERVKINGKMIPENEVISFVEKYKSEFEQINLSFFEWTVGLAFDYFATQEVDIAILETGLGGRLDSTNVVFPLVTAITNIGLDHTQFLGNTLQEIAKEKAGIIKKNTPIVIGEKHSETLSVFKAIANENNTMLIFAEDQATKGIKCDLKGLYQQQNIKTALAITDQLKKYFNITEFNIKLGLNQVVKNTGLLGRWQQLNNKPLTICDTGHNVEGVKYIIEQINSISYNKLHVVFGMVSDKSIDGVLELMPKNAIYYFCKPNIPRGLEAKELQISAKKHNLNGDIYHSVKEALAAANNQSTDNDMIYIGGSTFVVAEVV
jgi:dihydrofolate synthase/folylpolyglutamate synthase